MCKRNYNTRNNIDMRVCTECVLLMSYLTVCGVRAQRTVDNTGLPAGLLSDCPGAFKNASISPRVLKELQVVVHQLDGGEVYRKRYTLNDAVRMISADKHIDLQNRPTLLYVGGFLESTMFLHIRALATSYARRGYNVLMLETLRFTTYIYPKAVRISREIGKRTGKFIVELHKRGLPADRLELVGFSLGAHVSAQAASYFHNVTGLKVARLTGLDPAGPCFRNLPPEQRISPLSATKVDVVHTNIDGFGLATPAGHVDIYINGGEFQPGDILDIPCLVMCSHFRAILYWWVSIEYPKKFTAIQCSSIQEARDAKCYKDNNTVNYLGLETDFGKPGLYFLATKNHYPYYLGKEGLKKENEVFSLNLKAINADDELIV